VTTTTYRPVDRTEVPVGQRQAVAEAVAADLVRHGDAVHAIATYRTEHGGWCVKVVTMNAP